MNKIAFLLSIFALISATLTIYAKVRENETLQFIFKPLTMLAIILIVFLNSSSPMSFYQKAILTGLIFSTIGDVFLIKDKQFFVQGLISFLIGHICYIVAFWTNPKLPSGLIYLAYIVFFLSILWKHLERLKIPVLVYATAIALMSWMALSRTIENHNHHTFHAFLGSIMFVISDSLLAYNKFKSPIPLSAVWILGTYFLAQWLIALSV
jgi:uncharacterized membrane protein YhhN